MKLKRLPKSGSKCSQSNSNFFQLQLVSEELLFTICKHLYHESPNEFYEVIFSLWFRENGLGWWVHIWALPCPKSRPDDTLLVKYIHSSNMELQPLLALPCLPRQECCVQIHCRVQQLNGFWLLGNRSIFICGFLEGGILGCVETKRLVTEL